MTNDHFDLPDAPQKTHHPLVEVETPYRGKEWRYRGYHIWFDMPPVPTRAWDWHYQHEDCDLDDNRHGACASMAQCLAEIDDYIEEHEEEAE